MAKDVSRQLLHLRRCCAFGCRQKIDGVLTFCTLHWGALSDTEQVIYRMRLDSLTELQTIETRWSFYQHVSYLTERLRHREGTPPDDSLYDCFP